MTEPREQTITERLVKVYGALLLIIAVFVTALLSCGA